MKVIEQTSNHLILQTQPAGRLLFIVGLIFFGLPCLLPGIGATLSSFGNATKTLICERVESSEINCKITESSNQIPVTNLQEARVYPNTTNNSNEVVLITKGKNVVFSNNIDRASLINKFVINKDRKYLRLPDVNYLNPDFLVPFFMGLIFSSFGLAGLLFIRYFSFGVASYKFDKVQQILTVEEPSFTLIKTKSYDYPYSVILGFYFETGTDSDGDTYYKIRLKSTKDKKYFSIFSIFSFSANTDKNGNIKNKEQQKAIDLIMEYGIKGIFNLPNSKA